MVPRFARLFLFVLVGIAVPTLYIFYPSPPSLDNEWSIQAGGIDSPHWRSPVAPGAAGGLIKGGGPAHLEVGEQDEEDERPRAWGGKSSGEVAWDGVDGRVLTGGVIMPKLGNATAKAELGRAAWKVLHLITLRFPDEPTPDDRAALKSYFHLFSRLYPCGECAAEFQKLLKEYPPQTSSRKSASLWLCHVHNLVNERLGKPEFDCLTLDEAYDCGCGPEDEMTESTIAATSTTVAGRKGSKLAVKGGQAASKFGSKSGSADMSRSANVDDDVEKGQGDVEDVEGSVATEEESWST